MSFGCSPLTTIAFLTHRDEPKPAQYPFRPPTGPKHEKDQEFFVLVLVDQSPGRPEFAGAGRELQTSLAKQIPVEAKESKDKLTVIPPSQFDRFKMANANWKSMHPAEIGKRLKADVVMDIHLGNMSLYQPGSANQIYEGSAEVTVDIYDVTKGTGEPLHHYVHPHRYPKSMGLMSASDVPEAQFRQKFLDKLALDLARKHIDHKLSTGIGSEE
jgi:hypothetical protein